jgi:hypothetical protein
MRHLDYGTDWICHSTQVRSDQAIKLFDVKGEVLVALYETDIDWNCDALGHMDQRLYVDDLLRFVGIRDRVMYDVIMGTQVWNKYEPLAWCKTYTLVRRTCARCTVCDVACSRSAEHSLCSHGNLSHLWRTVRNERNGYLSPLIVEGYMYGDGIHQALQHGQLVTELTAIMSEFSIQMQDSFDIQDSLYVQETWLARR